MSAHTCPRRIALASGFAGLVLLLAPRQPVLLLPARSGVVEVCRLVGEPTNSFTYVPPPPRPSLLQPSSVTINVTYGSGFSAYPAAQAAFQYAVDIWKTQVTSSVPVTVQADFSALATGVLGSAGFTTGWRDFANAPLAGTWFPVPIVNYLRGSATNPSQPDISASFSSAVPNWYFGTDGHTPVGQYDFVSVVLHELGHGMGFSGSLKVASGLGSWGGGTPYPYVFDKYVTNGSNQNLIDTALFANNSAALAAQLTSNNVTWNGPRGVAANGGAPPQLYAPSTFQQGSSIFHLDDVVYPAGSSNSLMTHAIGMAEAIHDPGPIVRGMMQDWGWTSGCNYTLSSTSNATGAAGGTAGVTITTAASSCAWTATSNASWISVRSASSGSGNGVVLYSVASNSGAARVGTLTIGGQTLTISQGVGATMTLNHVTLGFAGTYNATVLTSITAPQDVTVTFSGATPAWTATASDPWVKITNGSGTGNGQFTVAILPSVGLPTSGTVMTTINVAASGVFNAPQQIAVSLTIVAGATQPPTGSFDTPVSGTTKLSGSFAVTGWAIDDTGIDRVEIWRDLAPGETTPPFAGPGPGHGKVFIARALFVNGARPDVEAAFPTSPLAYRAGWGYLLLSQGLWNFGNGPFVLYAFAYDVDGQVTTLGTKSIVVDNAGASKPFGAIDTPGYGASVSGSVWNYGWALTPGTSCTVSGGSVQVGVDSGPLQAVSYGGARTDIAGAFPGYTDSAHAGGAFPLDTTGLANGTHQIGWYVVDSCGRADGIGSRFFDVVNGSLVGQPDQAPVKASVEASSIADVSIEPIGLRRTSAAGVDGATEWIYPTSAGVRIVTVSEGERVVVQLPAASRQRYAGHQRIKGDVRALPVGSSLDVESGIFYWQPAAAFLGSFDLEFSVPDGGLVRVRVVVGPPMRMVIDTPVLGDTVDGSVFISGWALDLAAAEGTGIDTVHVWAYPATGADPIFLGVAATGDARPDVAAIFGGQFTGSSFSLVAGGLAPGTYDIAVFPHRAATGTFAGAQTVRIVVR